MNLLNKTTLTNVTLSIFTLASSSQAFAQDKADMIFQNGNILTVNENFDVADSLAISGNKIVAVGKKADLSNLTGENTKVINLNGKTVIPGLIDNHMHFIRGAWSFPREARLDGVFTRKEALEIIRKKALNSDGWVLTLGGFTPDQFTDNSAHFTVEELDKVAPNTPVYMQVSYRTAYANSAALKAAGVEKPTRGLRVRTAEGRKLNLAFGGRKRSTDVQSARDYMAYLNSFGLTTVYDVGRPSEGTMEPLNEIAKAGDASLRVFYTYRYRATNPEQAIEAIQDFTKLEPISSDEKIGLLGLGEHIYAPVSDSPRTADKWTEEKWAPFAEIATAAAKNGWPIHEHTMSHVTIGQYLDLIDDISKETPKIKTLRWALAHVNGIDEAQTKKAASLGVTIGVHSQAMMGSGMDKPSIAMVAESGALWGLGSDGGTVAPVDPFLTLSWAITGKNINNEKGLSKTISRKEALKAHTINNAKMLFKEDLIGSLEVGKLADLVVLNEDFMTMDSDMIKTIKPAMVIQDGKVVHTTDAMPES
ncbi:hypothetical protein EOL70_19900 [Leucothrix sargassi]|nr:hypothetical protein EOL70_19900 [Leucothrix sargassi]